MLRALGPSPQATPSVPDGTRVGRLHPVMPQRGTMASLLLRVVLERRHYEDKDQSRENLSSVTASVAQTAAGASSARTPVPARPNRLAPRAHDTRAGRGRGLER